jgi:DNA repair photolyase
MAILRALNEFTKESVVLALEPSRQCICNCTYCFASLNSKSQYENKKKDFRDPSTFEFTLEKAYSHNYNPEDFLQWAVRSRLVLGYANTVEPFQDIEQSKSILKACDHHSIPLFIQTKGINFFDVWSHLKPFHDNAALFVSFPTMDDRVLRRFEIGTPLSLDRLRVIETAANAGFHVILALSPYHEKWCSDPEQFIRIAKDAGVGSVFFDRLHLNIRQRKAAGDKVMVDLAHKTEHPNWPPLALEHYEHIYFLCEELGLPIFANGSIPIHFGWPNTLATISPAGIYTRGLQWTYHDGDLFHNLDFSFYDDEFGDKFDSLDDPADYDGSDSVLVRWPDVISIMESPTPINQEFSYSSLSDLISVKTLPKIWIDMLKPRARLSEYYRAIWNNRSHSFVWHHPFIKVALKPDGTPWTDEEGNIMSLYDPWFQVDGPKERVVETVEDFRVLEPEHDTASP